MYQKCKNLSKYVNKQKQINNYSTTEVKDAKRKISKVHFAYENVDEENLKGSTVEETNETEEPGGKNQKLRFTYTSRVSYISVTCFDNNGDERKADNRTCFLSASTAQMTMVTGEEEDEDEVFSGSTDGPTKSDSIKEAKRRNQRVYRNTLSVISIACYEDKEMKSTPGNE